MKSAVTSLADSDSLRIIYRYGSVICRPIPEAASLSRLLQLLIGCLRPGHLHRERETLEHWKIAPKELPVCKQENYPTVKPVPEAL
jgi:hypothetical protein